MTILKKQVEETADGYALICEVEDQKHRKERVDLSPSGTEGCVWEESFPWLDEVESGRS